MRARSKTACSGKRRAALSRLKRKEATLVALERAEAALRGLRRVLCGDWGESA